MRRKVKIGDFVRKEDDLLEVPNQELIERKIQQALRKLLQVVINMICPKCHEEILEAIYKSNIWIWICPNCDFWKVDEETKSDSKELVEWRMRLQPGSKSKESPGMSR